MLVGGCVAFATFLPLGLQAGTVSFADQVGNYFSFKNISEFGADIPPSNLDLPTLIANPGDAIRFRPSAFVAVESNGSIRESSSKTSTLSFTLESVGALALKELKIVVAGSYASTLFPVAGAEASVGLALELALSYGSAIKNLVVPILKETASSTWSGILTLSQSDLNSYFTPPAMEIHKLSIEATPTVIAAALNGNARSQITSLDFSVQAIPEPGTGSMLVFGLAIVLSKRGRKVS